MTWTVSPDAAQAVQRRFVVGSADVLSYGPSRGGQSLFSSTSGDVGRTKKLNSGIDRSATQLFEQRNDQAALETNTRVDSVFALGKSNRGWSRLASGILSAPGDFAFDEQIEIASIAAPTSAEATEIARDIIFANLASGEEKLPPPANPANPPASDQSHTSSAD